MPQVPELTSLADTVEIAPSVSMQRLGLGTYKAEPGADVEHEIAEGLRLGYRLVDTAALYNNEQSVGEAIRHIGVAREELFVTTKLWNTDHGFDETLAAFDLSLSTLGMDYVDLYLIHWPSTGLIPETWRAMEELVVSGRARAIGVCNFLTHHLERLLDSASIPPAVNQFEFHPRLQQPELTAYCQAQGITVQAWAPMMRGRVNLIPELVAIAQRHGKTPAQVSLRWILQRSITTIPKSVHSERIAENADVFDFVLTDGEMATIDALDAGQRLGPDPDEYV